MWRQPRRQPGLLRGIAQSERSRGRRGNAEAPARFLRELLARFDKFVGQEAEHALPALQHGGIEIDELLDAPRLAVGSAGDRWATERVADQDDVLEVLELQYIDDVLDEGVHRDRLRQQMRAFAE